MWCSQDSLKATHSTNISHSFVFSPFFLQFRVTVNALLCTGVLRSKENRLEEGGSLSLTIRRRNTFSCDTRFTHQLAISPSHATTTTTITPPTPLITASPRETRNHDSGISPRQHNHAAALTQSRYHYKINHSTSKHDTRTQ